MAKSILNKIQTQQVTLNNRLSELEKKERKTYEALAALIGFLDKNKKCELKTYKNFTTFKKEVLSATVPFDLKKTTTGCEPKFNVQHYERAIKCACDTAYRDMAIQVANKDLTHEAMAELVEEFRKDCRKATRCVKAMRAEIRKSQPIKNSVRRLLKNVVDPVVDDEDSVVVTG